MRLERIGEGKERKRILSLRWFPAAGFFLLDMPRMLGFRYFYDVGEDGG